jgi:hypothetical protein
MNLPPEISNLLTGQRLIENALGLNKPTKPMPQTTLTNPTKRSLIAFLEQLPVADDCRLNVSTQAQDIARVNQIGASTHPNEKGAEFLLDFTVA